MAKMVFLDGKIISAEEVGIDPLSQTLHYGNGVLEGLRSYETQQGPYIFKAKDHFERLAYSAARMRVSQPFTAEEMEAASLAVLRANRLQAAYIRPIIYAEPNVDLTATRQSHVLITAWEWGRMLGDSLVNLMISSFQRPGPECCFVDAKVCGYYAMSIAARTEARDNHCHDAVQLDQYGFVASSTTANIFMEKDEVLYTPRLGQIFPGITRQTVIELAQALQVEVVEKDIQPAELLAADSVFLAGTGVEITGVSHINRRAMKLAWEDSLGFILSRKYRQLVSLKDQHPFTLI
ncbi:MAG: aminotransferase class IV [Bacteroidota bacterium]